MLPASIAAGRLRFGWATPIGGSGALPAALVRQLAAHGGTVVTSAPVAGIDVRDGRAATVRTTDGRAVTARRAVVSGAHLATLAGMLDEPSEDLLRARDSWRPGLSVFAVHAALRADLDCASITVSQLRHRVGRHGAARPVQIAMNARDDSAVGRFWAEVFGWGVSSEEPGVTNLEPVDLSYPDPVAVCIDVIAVPEPNTVKNRVHLDLATTSAAHQADLVARLRDLGATDIDLGQGDVPWTRLAEPEGNEFDVLTPRYADPSFR